MQPVFDEQFLDELRQQGDPLADNTVRLIVEQINDVKSVITTLESLIRIPEMAQLQTELAELIPDIHVRNQIIEYFEISALPPAWADPALIRQGSELFREHALIALIILGCASLPACYCWEREAEILNITGRLKSDVPRRLPETAQMVLDVMAAEGLADQQGFGIRAVQKVRLLHAAIRVLTTQANELNPQNANTLPQTALSEFVQAGTTQPPIQSPAQQNIVTLPLNQEQLTATLLTFSYVIIDGLRRIGVRTTPYQEAAYMHCWNVIGHHLGINESVTSKLADRLQGQSVFDTLMRRNRNHSNAGAQLTTALIKYFAANLRRFFPLGTSIFTPKIPKILVSQLADKQTAAALGVKLNTTERILQVPVWGSVKVFGVLKNIPFLQRFSIWFFRGISSRVWGFRRVTSQANYVAERLGTQRGEIVVPAAIAEYWKITANRS